MTRPLRRLLFACALLCAAAWRPGRKRADAEEDKVPDTDGLIGLLAHTIYQYFDRPKYHVSVYLTLGSVLNLTLAACKTLARTGERKG